jgi:diguanylate cyclase (GGDEF)-like protein
MTTPQRARVDDTDDKLFAHLQYLVEHRQLNALLQPIIGMAGGDILGYEGLIRAPLNSPLHMPAKLFEIARKRGPQHEMALEKMCRQVVLQRFVALKLPGKLFLNVSPACLLRHADGSMLDLIAQVGMAPEQVIIELTENQSSHDYKLMRAAVVQHRAMGFQIAIDDLGAGFSSLRLWSELRPDYVKIDMHFIQGVAHDPVKLQFVRSIQEIARKSATLVIAEGIETESELLALRDIGVAYGQGYHLGRPDADPATSSPSALVQALALAQRGERGAKKHSIAKLLHRVASITPAMSNNDAYELFLAQPGLLIIPVVERDMPLGLLSRHDLFDHFARPYQRELYGKKSITLLMDRNPIIADQNTGLQELSFRVAQADAHHLLNGFIITQHGKYAGMGTGHDLMREITRMQITAARHANPLTQLPGNVPINECMDRLLASGTRFWACYCDLDHFKPFNDVYGYRKGDDVIEMTGKLLREQCDPQCDFIGHIGGDDFMILFQSEDWEQRCQTILDCFGSAIADIHSSIDRVRGGYESENRQGGMTFYPLISLSLGVVKVDPQRYQSHHQVAMAATDAKKQAKKMQGNSLFIERRDAPG